MSLLINEVHRIEGWDIHDPATQKREISALQSAIKELGSSKAGFVAKLSIVLFLALKYIIFFF